MRNDLKQTVLIGAIYGITVLVMAVLWFALPAEITAKVVLSFLFVLIPMTALFGTVAYSSLRHRDEVMQNGLLTAIAAIYLAAAVAVTVILGILPVGIRIYIIIQTVVLALGVIAVLLAFMAKNHIESN